MKGHIKERSPGKWAIVLDVPDPETGKRRRKWHTFHGTKRQAETECARLIAELSSGSYVEASKTTVREFLQKWLEMQKGTVSPKTHKRYEEILVKNVIPIIGNTRLDKLTAVQLDLAWKKLLDSGRRDGNGGLSARTVYHCRRITMSALEQGVRWDVIKKNPAALTRPPKVERPKMDAYDASETAVLLEGLRDSRFFIPALLASLCGLRRGEIAAARWKDVDLDGALLSVRESAEQTDSVVRYKEPKSGKTRAVALSQTVVDELRRHRAAQAEEMLRLGVRPNPRTFVVTNADGTAVKPMSITKGWTTAIKNLPVKKIRFHDLRHSHATQMLAAGVHPKIASERLGHATIGITLDLYTHVLPGMQANAAEQVDAAIREARNSLKK